jgi:predicted RNase H-like HicB family nuclease
MTRQFNLVVERDVEGFFVATVPSLPGCHTQARSLDQLMERVREAIELYVRDFKLRHYPPEVRHLVTPAKRPYRHIPRSERFIPPPGSMDSTEMIREMRGDR